MSMADRIRNWYEYEKDSNVKVMEMLTSVPETRRNEESFQTAIDKFAHAIFARKLWLYRFGYNDLPPATLFPQGVQLEELPEILESVYRKWDQYMSRLDDDLVASFFEYEDSEGHPYRDRIENVLVHLHGHMMYHRGQVATSIHRSGGTVVDTDYVFRTRQRLPDMTSQ